jgi:hypothetical protein
MPPRRVVLALYPWSWASSSAAADTEGCDTVPAWSSSEQLEAAPSRVASCRGGMSLSSDIAL